MLIVSYAADWQSINLPLEKMLVTCIFVPKLMGWIGVLHIPAKQSRMSRPNWQSFECGGMFANQDGELGWLTNRPSSDCMTCAREWLLGGATLVPSSKSRFVSSFYHLAIAAASSAADNPRLGNGEKTHESSNHPKQTHNERNAMGYHGVDLKQHLRTMVFCIILHPNRGIL